MKWNYVFIWFFFGLNRIVFFSFDDLECIELEEIFMFLDINFIVDYFFLYFLFVLMINMWIVWFFGRLDLYKVGLFVLKEFKFIISYFSFYFNNKILIVLLEL